MPKLEPIPTHNNQPSLGALFRHAMAARTMLEKAWDDQTAYQGITLTPEDAPSRGQCGVSAVWLGRHLLAQGVDTYFTEGTMNLNNQTDEHVWLEVRNVGSEPLVVDITSDQYQTIHGTTVHLGVYSDEHIGGYYPREYFSPLDIPHKKLMARYALLEANISRLPRRHRIR